jgi:hypothetical protein
MKTNRSVNASSFPVRAANALLFGVGVLVAGHSPLQAEQTVTTGVASGQTLQVTDPFRVVTSGTVEVQSGATAVFRSPNTVSLQPGFKAAAGGFFHAAISQVTSIPLAWTATAGSIRYDIYRNGVKIGEATQPNYLDATASAGGLYTYVIKAIASGGGETVVLTTSAQAGRGLELFTPLLPATP